MTSSNDDIFFGFDLSTQQIKVVAVDKELNPLCCYSVSFDDDLPHYKTTHGVFKNDETGRVIAPVEMWLEALDLLLTKMKIDEFDFSKVKGISGSCQQHGSVYWSKESENLLSTMENSLQASLKNAFSYEMAPNWQDHSTVKECKEFTEKIGGEEKLAKLTGSKAYHRFTGPQIKKFIKENYEQYEKTFKITLVSNFLSTIFLGKFAKIDEADGCGMNLYDIENRKWNEGLLKITVSDIKDDKDNNSVKTLIEKLGRDVEPVGFKSSGKIADYFVKTYNFDPDCQIYPFTGDNLATILSLPLLKNDLLISLGTSTTILLITDVYKPNPNFHIMIHPTNPKLYMYMICYSNGAIPRNLINSKINEKYQKEKPSWDVFNEILNNSEKYLAAKDGNIGVYFSQGEIIPNVDHPLIVKYKFDVNNGELIKKIETDYHETEVNVKGIIESQALSGRIRVEELFKTEDGSSHLPHKLFFVGGASRNQAIITKFSEILGNQFQAENGGGNYKSLEPNGCALGGAYKANWSYYGKEDYEDYLEKKFNWENLKEFKVDYQWDDYKIAELALRNLEKIIN